MDIDTLREEYQTLQTEATRLAGGLEDIPRRVVVLNSLYLDSGRNHAFSQIAAHGALWAFNYFEIGGRLGRLIAQRYFYSRKERAYRLGLLQEFAEGFRRVNRQVCIDTYSNYHFTRRFGEEAGAEHIVPLKLLDALNRVHAARRANQELSVTEKRDVFSRSFEIEQEVTVAPGVKIAIDGFDCPIMKFVCMHPLVRFAYFPPGRLLHFHDFSSREERIAKGLEAYGYAESVGWPKVADSMRAYRVLPERYFASPQTYWQELTAQNPAAENA